ncbi:hypothetical protein FE257_001584 [Aspergillus nanangensis]|uniref:Uncharacterized protein n=1 Tax=Aspergillus nanangensis TaxID=2582783 RepID=A0AAD4CTL7_ASPNN|nr:hypothetical protein FE257_001584 [Aspergillus nanangensis]
MTSSSGPKNNFSRRNQHQRFPPTAPKSPSYHDRIMWDAPLLPSQTQSTNNQKKPSSPEVVMRDAPPLSGGLGATIYNSPFSILKKPS